MRCGVVKHHRAVCLFRKCTIDVTKSVSQIWEEHSSDSSGTSNTSSHSLRPHTRTPILAFLNGQILEGVLAERLMEAMVSRRWSTAATKSVWVVFRVAQA